MMYVFVLWFGTETTIAWRRIEMLMNERRESAQIIQFPLNARINARHMERAAEIGDRMVEALEPAWYHSEAVREPSNQPKH